MSITDPIKYSYEWAQNTVQKFTERYARGTYFVAKMLDICHEELCSRLILELRLQNQFEWEASKKVIKMCKNANFRDYKHISVMDRRKYLTIVKVNAKENVLSEKFAQNELDYHPE